MPTKLKALSFSDWRKLITHLNFHDNSEMIIYLGAVTGMRYAEILGLTKCDLNAVDKTINVNKTWDYKYRTGFKKTKNAASVRIISISSTTVQRLQTFIASKRLGPDDPLFLNNGRAPVSADINKTLTNILQKLGLPRITFHGLHHTHTSVLLYQGVSVLSVSRRLGHSGITTTQSTYLYVIKELEQQDNDKIISILGDLLFGTIHGTKKGAILLRP